MSVFIKLKADLFLQRLVLAILILKVAEKLSQYDYKGHRSNGSNPFDVDPM